MVYTEKVYYSIREVAEMTSLEPHVLRYWESEFSTLRPKKNRAGNRVYREKDIATVLKIKDLLYEQKFTISGARKRLTENTPMTDRQYNVIVDTENSSVALPKPRAQKVIESAVVELEEILTIINRIKVS